MDPSKRAQQKLAELHRAGLLRRPPTICSRDGVRYTVDGQPVIGLCSNDYLGLAAHSSFSLSKPSLHSTGAGASRLICGDLSEHRALESRLAEHFGTPDAVLFPSGFQLNVGALPALLESEDRVGSDALNHASLIDGIRLSRVRPYVLPHRRPPEPTPVGPSSSHWWITESIFSMDGDRIDPAAAQDHLTGGGALYIDEAHALGLFEGGLGWLGHHQIQATAMVGTFSKAFGCAGAFIAASTPLCDLIRNRARSFVFSTGVSPIVTATIEQAMDIVFSSAGDELREQLWSNTRHLLRNLDHEDPEPPSPIIPIVIGDNDAALQTASALLDRGWHVQAIRPPTVPTGSARLRITVTAIHQPSQLDAFCEDLLSVLQEQNLPLRIERGTTAWLEPPESIDPPSPSVCPSTDSS